ncbi:ABC transporter ATP-binding protein [Devosia sp. MC532]|uniref:ABC transporter ATP-binding protein n=1 Tax=Devosia sp. MC532 TaxID=2799788 RepID=UPI0018F2831D|nr:ABC transporter ATP-binding protein [Devosia sp. MC532]MBJ7577790.1 ABC transporter ATP-binding protein [Devosia sp. MC532]
MTSSQEGIRVADVSKRYGRTLALDGVSFEVKPRELFALLGPNGAGKTTLMHILSTVLRPDSGTAELAGHNVVTAPLEARDALGIIFQEPSLDDRLTLRENLNLHGLVFGIPRRHRLNRINEMLALVELTEWADKPARALSSGMKRRLEIARALMHDSKILLLDEPTVGLDAQTRERIWGYIRKLQADRGLTVLVTTHYIEEVEACDRVCIIDHGKVLALDTPDALRAAHGQQVLHVTPRSETDRAAILSQYADRLISQTPVEVTLRSDEAFVETFLGAYGTRVSNFVNAIPSLETVFLTLTGRELRDRAATARERTAAFGKRGGEHTR